MKRVAALTVIKGNGECIALYNEKVNEEMYRLQRDFDQRIATMEAELEATRRHRNALLASMNRMRERQRRERTIPYRVKDWIETKWGQFFCMLIVLGLISDSNDDD